MQVGMGLNLDIDDDDDEKVEIAEEIIMAEFRKFAAHVMSLLEERGMTDVTVQKYEED